MHREPIGVQIRDLLSAAESITQNLSVLSAPMKDGIEPNPARTELRNIVRETEQYFGSERILRQYSVDRRLFGAEALRAARIAAEREKIKDLEALRKKEEALRRKEEEWKEEELRRERDRLREKGRPTLQLPTYVKVHKDHLDVETLMYYQMPYERDRVGLHFRLAQILVLTSPIARSGLLHNNAGDDRGRDEHSVRTYEATSRARACPRWTRISFSPTVGRIYFR